MFIIKQKKVIPIFLSIILIASLATIITFSRENSMDKDLGQYTESPNLSGFETLILRPNGNYQLEWESSSYANIDDEVTQGETTDGNYNYENRLNYFDDIFEMSENSTSSGIALKITQIKLWFYARAYAWSPMGNPIGRLYMGVKINGKWQEGYIANEEDFSWHSNTYTGEWAPEIINDLQLNARSFLSYSGAPSGGIVALDCAYLEVTFQILDEPCQDINIETSGVYAGTYGFENDIEGTYGTDISFLDEWTGNMGSYLRMYVRYGPYEGHFKVLEIFDSQAGGKTTGVHNFDNPQSSGTIEFWLMMKGAAEVGSTDRFHEIHFRKSDNTIAFRAQLKMLEGGWVSGDRADVAYYDGNDWVEFADGEDFTWYRHRIDFDCTSGANGKFSWYIYHADDSLLASITDMDFENSMGTLDEIFFTSITSHYRGSTYWDAFGFSWDPNYNVGDNVYEMFQTADGYFPATHGFEDTEDGQVPHNWNDISIGSDWVKVASGMTGHNKVLHFRHVYWWGFGHRPKANTNFEAQSYGAIDFWFYTTMVQTHKICLSGSTDMIQLLFNPNGWNYWDGSEWQLIPKLSIDYGPNKWFHIQISFELTGSYFQGLEQNHWKIRIDDGEKFDYSEPMETQGYSDINTLNFEIITDVYPISHSTYIDAVGYTWDPSYEMYDNLYPGILVDIEPDDLTYMECNYYGLIRQIYGDTVLPTPKSGLHTLNVYGEEGSTRYYGSFEYLVNDPEKIGVFFSTRDVCDGEDAQPPFLYSHKVEKYVDKYRDVLAGRGYSRIYVYSDMNNDEFDNMFECLARKRVDGIDEIFVSISAHGMNAGDQSYFHIIPSSICSRIIFQKDLNILYNEVETDYKGLLVSACHSGGFVNEFDEFPYLVMSSCMIDQDDYGDKETKEFYFEKYFWGNIGEGYNVLDSFDYAQYLTNLVTAGKQTPQMEDNMPDGFIFFDD
ncbi:MAG: hypothetical protein ACFFBE_16080 [Promethearchaeota archaeon]